MSTPPLSPNNSPPPSPKPSKLFPDDDLLDFAQMRIEESERAVRSRAFFSSASSQSLSSPPLYSSASSSPSPPPSRTSISSSSLPSPLRLQFSPSSFSSPAGKAGRPPIPPTPGFHLKKPKDDKTIFPGNTLTATNDPTPIITEAPVSFRVVYQDQGGLKHNLLKQPEGSKSCWAYSFVMFLSDLIRSGKSLKLDEAFWHWFQKSYLRKAEEVKEQASQMGIQLEQTQIPFEDPLTHIRGQIEKSGFPVLTSIDHHIFSGHAIVVDSVTDTHTIIRDPYGGMAWNIPNEEMKSYYGQEEDFEDAANKKCLSFKQA